MNDLVLKLKGLVLYAAKAIVAAAIPILVAAVADIFVEVQSYVVTLIESGALGALVYRIPNAATPKV